MHPSNSSWHIHSHECQVIAGVPHSLSSSSWHSSGVYGYREGRGGERGRVKRVRGEGEGVRMGESEERER